MSEKHIIGRIGFLVNELSRKGYFYREEISEHVLRTTGSQISESTIKRTISDIREYFGIDIVYSIKNKRYEVNGGRIDDEMKEDFLDKFSEVRHGKTDSNELLLFYSFVKSMIRSEYFFPPVNVAEKKDDESSADYEAILRIIESVMKNEMSEKSMSLSDCIEYHISEHYKSGQKIKFNRMLCVLLDSMKKRQLVKFVYHGTEVHVEPVKIIHYEGKWYFMGFIAQSSREDHLKKVRTYNLSLINDNIHLTKKKFTGEAFEIPDYKDSFGIIASSNIRTARIRFYDDLADRMKEMVWFDGQKTLTGASGDRGKYCEYILPYPSNTSFELLSRVLSFANRAEVIEPEDLRESWKEAIKKMYDMIK
jgi:hypothetical protein